MRNRIWRRHKESNTNDHGRSLCIVHGSKGRVYSAADVGDLSKVFVQIAGGNVATVLEAEIGRRISDAVTNRLAAEYLG